jgi:hypothetical protein
MPQKSKGFFHLAKNETSFSKIYFHQFGQIPQVIYHSKGISFLIIDPAILLNFVKPLSNCFVAW